MAEIHVQTKKQSSNLLWLWIVLGLLIIGAIVYYIVSRNNNQQQTNPAAQPNAASQLYPQSRPPRPQRVDIVIPVVYMRSV